VAAWIRDIFLNFDFAKIHENGKIAVTTEAEKKINTD
jgi:ssDNA-specific exonuclease RecJ